MYSKTLILVALLGALFASVYGDTSLCTGYPKTFNGKPCASTTRYWDGQMGACGCGTGDQSPFSWQWTKPTAAASAPIYGAGTWCGTGCGKCFKLTPTGAGASPVGRGAPNTNALVIKVTNLCPAGGNEQWCSSDVNSYNYDAHFDLMDYNMNGLVTQAGWDNPEVTYEEVDCASNGYNDWSCQCASGGSSAPSSGATTKPTTAPASSTTKAPSKAPATVTTKAPATVTTKAPSAPTPSSSPSNNAPASSAISVTLKPGVNSWWLGFSVTVGATYSKIEVMDSNNGAYPSWAPMSYHGDQYWNMYFINPSKEMKLPLSLRFTNSAGKQVVANNVITAWTASGASINTGVSL